MNVIVYNVAKSFKIKSHDIAILAIYRFDTVFDTESGLPEKCKYFFAQLGSGWVFLAILQNKCFKILRKIW